jgi:hypothetical protein
MWNKAAKPIHALQLLALCLALLAGCARQLPLSPPVNTPVQVFEVGGPRYTLEPSSEDYRSLARWVESNRSGWSWAKYYARPPAKGIIVRSGTLNLQFVDSTIFAHMPEGDYVKKVTPSEYAFLRRRTAGPTAPPDNDESHHSHVP